MEHVFLKVAPCNENQGSSQVIAVEITQSSKNLGIITMYSLRMSRPAPSCWRLP
jgi:hypothetical protein